MGGSLEQKELERYSSLKTFIETGTYKGESARLAAGIFRQVFTIELSPELFQEAVAAATKLGLDTSGYCFGDSAEILRSILVNGKDILGDCFFFLDAHISGPDSTWNGTDLVPVMKEIELINDLYPSTSKAVVCVDDVRLFSGPPDWRHVNTEAIRAALNKHTISGSYVSNDRFYLVLNTDINV